MVVSEGGVGQWDCYISGELLEIIVFGWGDPRLFAMPWDLSACHGISQHAMGSLSSGHPPLRLDLVCHAMGSLSSGHPPLRLDLRHNADTLTQHVAPCLA
jgi:hypothetical protein